MPAGPSTCHGVDDVEEGVVSMSRDPDTSSDGRRLPRRATDRVEDVVACVLLAAAFVVLVVAWLNGTAVYRANAEPTNTTAQTKAVLLEDAQAVPSAEPGLRLPLRVDARWTDRTGAEHTGQIRVKEPAPAGSRLDVWVGPDGAASTSPPGRANAVTAGVVTGAGLLLAGGSVLATLWFGVRFLTNARNYRRWEREWARVGPEWSGRSL